MFGITFIKKKELSHLTAECGKLAIANVELSKENAMQAKSILQLSSQLRILQAKLRLEESVNDELQKKLNQRFPRKPYNKKLKNRIS